MERITVNLPDGTTAKLAAISKARSGRENISAEVAIAVHRHTEDNAQSAGLADVSPSRRRSLEERV